MKIIPIFSVPHDILLININDVFMRDAKSERS